MAPRTTEDFADHYSPRNVLTLLAAGATEVAGYREWQEAGRQVRKGEHGIRILAPVVKKDDDGNAKVVNVKTATVFDISQTDPLVPQPEPVTEASIAADKAASPWVTGEFSRAGVA